MREIFGPRYDEEALNEALLLELLQRERCLLELLDEVLEDARLVVHNVLKKVGKERFSDCGDRNEP